MKFGKTVASILAATMAVSALSASAFADEDKIKLMTAEIPAELATSMVFFDGVGVVDISGVGYDSSENGNADKTANLDVDFDGLGYVSEKNLEAWRETGTLTFSKLKANFDTKGLQWGMFDAKNNYVQLVKMVEGEKKQEYEWVGDSFELVEVPGDPVVVERGLYQITDGELKKLCDLDTSWTYTREDGISVGIETVFENVHIKEVYAESKETINELDTEAEMEFNLVVTQPDGTKSVKTIAKSNITDTNITIEWSNEESDDALDNRYSIGTSMISTPSKGDVLANVFYGELPLWGLMGPSGESVAVKKYYKDGTEKEIFKSKDSDKYIATINSWPNGNIFWSLTQPVVAGRDDYYFYNEETGEITSLLDGEETANLYDLKKVNSYSDRIIAEFYMYDENGEAKTGYAIFDNVEDLKNKESKTFYKDITPCEDNVYLYETLDGKVGYMNGDEKVLAEFDDAEAFSDNYAPVVKDGKAYLVDKKMNIASEQIDADSVVAVSDNIFIVNNGDKKYFATYEGGNAEDDTPSTPAVLVDYSDDATGIKASANEGVIADGAKLSVAAVADKTDDKNFTYEISFKKDDKEVQPNGKVTVKIPVPEAIKDKKIFVYRVEDGKYYDMGAKVKDGFVVFTTNHFSEYLVTVEEREDAVKPSNDNPPTGIPVGILATMAIAGAVMVVSKKRR